MKASLLKTLFITPFFFLICRPNCIAQHQEREVFLYNVSFGAITSGIGSIINKPKDVNWRKAFLRGAWQGSIGGLVNYASKKTLYEINRQRSTFYALPARIMHAASSSVIENAALYQPFLKNWNIDYGPVRFDFSTNGNFKARLLPEAVYAYIRGSEYGNLDVKESLLSGVFVFSSKSVISFPARTGVSYGRSVAYTNVKDIRLNKYQVLAHEYTHTFQYREYQVFNTWLKPVEKKINSKVLNTIFSKYVYFDAPYISAFYGLEGRYPANRYFRNFYEFEAERFSTNSFVPYRH